VRTIERDRQRRHAALIIEAAQHNGPGRLRLREHLEINLSQHGERAVGAGHELGEVIAGDILHHAAARLESLASPTHRVEAQEVITRRALLDAARARDIAGEHAA